MSNVRLLDHPIFIIKRMEDSYQTGIRVDKKLDTTECIKQ